MSSSFFVDRDGPVDITETLRALDRSGLVWADGDLASLRGGWPDESLLLYIPGVSSRGVEVVRDGKRFQIRLLAMSSPGDYDLAFRLIEVLGGTTVVDPEEGEPTPADKIRERFGGAWMQRDMATSVAALRASLQTGAKVMVSGPVQSLELEPAVLETADLTRLYEVLVRAQASRVTPTDDDLGLIGVGLPADREPDPDPAWDAIDSELALGDAEHRAHLEAQEKADPLVIPKQKVGWLWMIAGLVIFLVVLVPGLITRALVLPFRDVLRGRRERHRERRLTKFRADMIEKTAAMRAAPDDADPRHDRALAIMFGPPIWRTAADRELLGCLSQLEAGACGKITRGAIHHNLSITRSFLHLPRLSKRAEDAAREAGHELHIPILMRLRMSVRFLVRIVVGPFRWIAGLDAD